MRTSWPLGRHVAPFYSGIYSAASTALAIFNDRIIRQAIEIHIPVADLRTAVSDAGDYSPQGLLSRSGLTKVAALIWRTLDEGSTGRKVTQIFCL